MMNEGMAVVKSFFCDNKLKIFENRRTILKHGINVCMPLLFCTLSKSTFLIYTMLRSDFVFDFILSTRAKSTSSSSTSSLMLYKRNT